MIIQFKIPDDPLSLNKMPTTQWKAKKWRATKNAWREATCWAAVAAFPGKGPEGRRMPPCDIYASIPVAGNYRRDFHNLSPTLKPIVDGLVDAGLWVDDTPEYVDVHTPDLRPVPPAEIWNHMVYLRLEPK